MKAKGCGHIINVASIVGWAANWGFVAYVTSKHAMVGLTKAMANELAPTIHVNGICPGAIKTAMLDSVGGEDVFAPMIARTALKRVGQGSEIASVALFLATSDSSFVDGQLIRVDGGVDI
jgi:3-oxoacyl-[acyl-carrier protein] reductase